MKKIYLLFIILTSLFLYGCSVSCGDLESEVQSQYGKPEEVNHYVNGDYDSTDWWYWSKGIEFTFTRSGGKPCEKSTYTFTPVNKPMNKKLVDKKLIKVEYANGCIVEP